MAFADVAKMLEILHPVTKTIMGKGENVAILIDFKIELLTIPQMSLCFYMSVVQVF